MITAPYEFVAANDRLLKKAVLLIEIAGYWIKFVNRKTGVSSQQALVESVDDQSTTISDLEGGSELGDLVFTVSDLGLCITKSFPSFVFKGKRVTLKTGLEGMDQADFVTLFTGVVDKVESTNANASYTFTCTDNKQSLSKVVYRTGDDGFSTDGDHPRTLNGNPLDLLLACLRDEVGLPDEEIDVAKIESYRDTIFAGVQFQFSIDSPPAARDFIEGQLMKPLGGYLWVKNDGKVSVNFFYPLDKEVKAELDERFIIGVPEATQSELVNVMSFRFDKSEDDGKFMSEDVEEYGASTALYGQFGQQVVESDGMRSSLQGFFVAASTARLVFLRYGSGALKFEPLTLLWNQCRLEPGDLVEVTHSRVPDREAGAMGISAKKFLVLDRSWNFKSLKTDVLLVDASSLDLFGFYKYAPDGHADYDASSAEDKAKYMFMCGDDDLYSDASPANRLG